MTMQVNSTAPDAAVLFFPFKKQDTSGIQFGTPDVLAVNTLDARDDIIELTTSKGKGGVGTFTITLAPNRNYKKLLNHGCWCLIYLSDQQLPDTKDLGSAEDGGLKMVGIVRSVRRKEVTQKGGKKTLRFFVSGEDFQSVFNTPIYINQNLTALFGGQGSSFNESILVLGPRFANSVLSPSQLIDALIDSLLGKPAFIADSTNTVSKVPQGGRTGQPYLVPPEIAKRVLGFKQTGSAGNFFMGLIVKFLQGNLLGKINVRPEISGATIPVWSFLQSYCHRLLNEMYTDLLPVSLEARDATGKPTGDFKIGLVPSLVLRAIPFSEKKLHPSCIAFLDAGGRQPARRSGGKAISPGSSAVANNAKKRKTTTVAGPGTGAHFYISRKITEDEIMGFDSGKSDHERFNFFFVTQNLTSTLSNEIDQLKKIIGPNGPEFVSDQVSISRYGFKPFITQSNYMVSSDGGNTSIINSIVKDIWSKAHLYENGTVSLRGIAQHIPVGTNIEFIERGWRAHVERVDNVFAVVDPDIGTKEFRTNVAFVRMQTGDGLPIELTENTDIQNLPFDFEDISGRVKPPVGGGQ